MTDFCMKLLKAEWEVSQQEGGEEFKCYTIWQMMVAMLHSNSQLRTERNGYTEKGCEKPAVQQKTWLLMMMMMMFGPTTEYGGHGWPCRKTPLHHVLQCQIWSFRIKMCECNYGDFPEKFDPLCPAFQVTHGSNCYRWLPVVNRGLSPISCKINGDYSRK